MVGLGSLMSVGIDVSLSSISLLVFCIYIETKELCEARVKPEMSSNLADEPSSANVLPPI